MSIRETLNNNSAGVAIGAVVVLAIALVVVLGRGGGGGGANQQYFMDLTTGDLVAMPSDTIAPTTLPNGNQGVQAFVYSCNDCKDKKDLEPSFVLRYSDRAMESTGGDINKLNELLMNNVDAQEIATAADAREGNWLPSLSPEGNQLQSRELCPDGERPVFCRP